MTLNALYFTLVLVMDVTEGSQRKGRKRLRQPDRWTRNKNKKLKVSGKEYVDSKGRIVQKTTMRAITCRCNYGCHRNVSSEEAERIFKAFYDSESYDLQNIYLAGQINVKPVV